MREQYNEFANSQSGKRVVRSFSMPQGLIAKMDVLAQQIKSSTGVQVDRSKLFMVLSDLLLEAQHQIRFDQIEDMESLKNALLAAIIKTHQKTRYPHPLTMSVEA